MSKEAMEKALEALEFQPYLAEWYMQKHIIPDAIVALKEALKQEEQKRAWVSLTNEEQQHLYDQWKGIDGWGVFYDSIEKALKEKNHV